MHSKSNVPVTYIGAAIFLLAAFFFSLSIGSVTISLNDISATFLHSWFGLGQPVDAQTAAIILNIRLPRVVLACLVGMSLSLAGASLQGLLRNPLADPYTLGISSGASLGAVLTLSFAWTIPGLAIFSLPIISATFAFITLILVILFTNTFDRSMRVESLILTGIITSSFLGAIMSLVIALSGEELRQIIGWLLGSVSMRGWSYTLMLLPFFLLASILLLWQVNELNALAHGENRAHHLGVNVKRSKWIVLTAASVLAGVAVSVSGTIGFVGLVIPHLVRLITGANHRHVLPLSVIIGGGYLMLADLFARTVISPTELPIGVVTALIGAPVFGLLVYARARRNRS
ncbi:FecCD family ABC transporter permease [Mangrovibacillus cuniculi]|nr:iron ABC transporter permease [Mangrovibacillus cuniculi]